VPRASLLLRQWPVQNEARWMEIPRVSRTYSTQSSPRPSSPSSPSSKPSYLTSSQTARPKSLNPMSWSTYLSLRRSQRTYGLLASIPTTLVGGAIGFVAFATVEVDDPTQMIFGMDPLWVYGIATVTCLGLGYLIGPIVGTTVWRSVHRNKLADMDKMEKEFHRHIVKNRVDPSRQSVANPVPDYYGEKIGSLKQYRQWLRDQNAYRRKASFGAGGEGMGPL